MYRELVAGILSLLLAFSVGWVVNGWRLNAKIEQIQKEHTQALLTAESNARKAEQTLVEQAQQEKVRKDAELKVVGNKLSAVLIKLRDRPERNSEVPTATPARPVESCTGTELYRQDAEFLIREAARADEVVIQLMQCQNQYNAARNELRK